MKSLTVAVAWLCLVGSVGLCHEDDGVWGGPRDAEQQALAERLHVNAHASPKRFEDISLLKTWFIGSCVSGDHVFHFRAYFDGPDTAYIGVFGRDEQLRTFWKFACDARQFYTDRTKLMFVAHPQGKGESAEAFARAPRQVLLDVAALPKEGSFFFDGATYPVPPDI